MFEEPLAFRMRPRHIDEIAGQSHVIGKETILYKIISQGVVPSILLYGPPGVGKTSIADAIKGTVSMPFYSLNATTSGKKDVEEIVSIAKKIKQEKKTAKESIDEETSSEEKEKIQNMPSHVVLFIDEVHRFNKAQQDILLPSVEDGTITLIGATTSNPFHDVNPAIRSRMGEIKQLSRLTAADIKPVLQRAIENSERGLASFHPVVEEELINMIAESVNGEVRSALTALEMCVLATEADEEGKRVITRDIVIQSLKGKGFSHDKNGDAHYDVLSAFQKSIRGSDVDAALHYLARLIQAGDMDSITRRLSIIAFEDISLANTNAWSAVMAAISCAERTGFPEARIPLANAVALLCLSPKSNSAYKALDAALVDLERGKMGEIPPHLKDGHYKNAKTLGHSVGYQYPHDYPGGWVNQQYLPDLLKDREYYEPRPAGQEKQLGEVHKKLKELKNKKTP